ncbi:VOC family protein [Luteipulveratus halotolerans]|uniref:Glyoxalase n=1 Tax=Luteipulveratus halotolerans TaxID=1631356 RepID=A0A0L6CKY9_9MICO|nr:VOC family protein [Luteipulveratus halotolerans]KNX38399.1 glyoxalase [Luteipulveratus halotolerans]
MRVTEIIADLPVADIDAARDFYADYLGLSNEEFNLGWVARFTSPESGAHVQVVTKDATAPEDAAISVKVDDVDAAYAEARRRGYEIVHPLVDEEWGVRRFFVRSPDGTVINMVAHRV